MNILHMRYAVEVARLGSLNKAADTLLIAQPNISRSIRELEKDLGISIFIRSSKGMVLTPEGKEFIGYAKGILKQIDDVELLYKGGARKKQKFSISTPHACYISEAFAEFSKGLAGGAAEVFYKETDSQSTLNALLGNDCRLGIIRYAENFDKHFKTLLEEKGLCGEPIATFSYRLIISRENPLAQKEELSPEDLAPLIELSCTDHYVPELPFSKAAKEALPHYADRRITTLDRAGRMDLLSENPMTFMWASPVSPKMLDRYGLVQRQFAEFKRVYRDVLIYRNGYKLSKLDKLFIAALRDAQRRIL